VRQPGNIVRRGRRVGHVDRHARIRGVDGVYFPSPEHGVHERIPAATEPASSSKWELVYDAGDVDEFHIDAQRPIFVLQIPNVLRVGDEVAGRAFKRLLGIAQRFRPGERVQKIETGYAKAMLKPDGKA